MCDCGSKGCEHYCGKCGGMIWGLLGVLILINAFVWPQWAGIDGWMAFFGILLIIAGVWKSLMPGCKCHSQSKCCEESKDAAKEVVIPAENSKAPSIELPKAHKKKK